ncbi:hypothetical protein ADK35_23960 [Streptomyces viridochromogenes]|nr:hypothetical protein ADK35_23960 [Streptomyces viridochromogenes]
MFTVHSEHRNINTSIYPSNLGAMNPLSRLVGVESHLDRKGVPDDVCCCEHATDSNQVARAAPTGSSTTGDHDFGRAAGI